MWLLHIFTSLSSPPFPKKLRCARFLFFFLSAALSFTKRKLNLLENNGVGMVSKHTTCWQRSAPNFFKIFPRLFHAKPSHPHYCLLVNLLTQLYEMKDNKKSKDKTRRIIIGRATSFCGCTKEVEQFCNKLN